MGFNAAGARQRKENNGWLRTTPSDLDEIQAKSHYSDIVCKKEEWRWGGATAMVPLWNPFNCYAFTAFLSDLWEIWGPALLLQMALARTWSIRKVVCCPSNHCQVNWKTVQFKADLEYTSIHFMTNAEVSPNQHREDFSLDRPPGLISTFVSNAVSFWILGLFSLTLTFLLTLPNIEKDSKCSPYEQWRI